MISVLEGSKIVLNIAASDENSEPKVKRQRPSVDCSLAEPVYQSQPTLQLNERFSSLDSVDSPADVRSDFCFSQPVLMDNLILCTQLNPTQGNSQNAFHRLVKRMTRFTVTAKHDQTIQRLTAELSAHRYTYKITENSIVSSLNRPRSAINGF